MYHACVCAQPPQSYLTLWGPMDGSPPNSSVHGLLRQDCWSGLPCPLSCVVNLGFPLLCLSKSYSSFKASLKWLIFHEEFPDCCISQQISFSLRSSGALSVTPLVWLLIRDSATASCTFMFIIRPSFLLTFLGDVCYFLIQDMGGRAAGLRMFCIIYISW